MPLSADASGPEDSVQNHGTPLLDTSAPSQSHSQTVTAPHLTNPSPTQTPMEERLSTQWEEQERMHQQEEERPDQEGSRYEDNLSHTLAGPSTMQFSAVRSSTVAIPVMVKTSANGDYVERMMDEAQRQELYKRYPSSRPFIYIAGVEKRIVWKSIGMFYRQCNKKTHIDAF
ncbi:hypothetical protein TWF706_010347 [Orbilia oligospora]|nr:hypothetical protein TWF706_010347 [Orbilia oligospora]